MKREQKLGVILAALCASLAGAKVKVAASLPDLASIAAYVGGDQVEVFSIARPNANPHFVEVLPSYMIRVARADVYLKAGLGMDPWADAVLEGSRNNSIRVVDASAGVAVLEKPAGKVDASQGDVHPQGNPHYWLDPANGARIAETVRDALKRADPAHAALYDANAARFRAEAETRLEGWKERMAPLKGSAIVTYHSSWVYFARAFGLRVVGHVEPFPGIPPTARHLRDLVGVIRASQAKILLQEPYYPGKDPEFLARETGIRVHRFTPACEGTAPGDYLKHFDAMVAALSGGGSGAKGGKP
ncbi:MAG: periplasmic solute binding protein [Fibrobacteria bacterium]|jgi:zinc/manganese transport system substrate-binding protein|nr:periplasmic solute binding protein [Fibrobacteria bacterium]